MKKVLIIAPEFPPANSAAVHRSRLFARHLPAFGWKPTVLTMRESDIEGPLDRNLLKLLSPELEVVRTPAIPVKPLRWLGDTGLRCLPFHKKALDRMTQTHKPDLIFIPGPPWFMFLLGPYALKHYGIPYVLDYIDPWKTHVAGKPAWGKSRIYDALAAHFEKKAVAEAGFITAVSQGIGEDLFKLYGFLDPKKFKAMPYGSSPEDFEALGQHALFPPDFKPDDGYLHLCFTGALQPNGFGILRCFFEAVALLRHKDPGLFSKIRLHFYGTSNSTSGQGLYRVKPLAKEFGLEENTSEIPERIPYLQALAVQKYASLNLVTGSADHYYHASKLYPCLLSGRPILGICHEASSIFSVLESLGLKSCVTFSESRPLQASDIMQKLTSILKGQSPDSFDKAKLEPYLAKTVSGQLAEVFDHVIRG